MAEAEQTDRRSLLEKALGVVTEVREGEGPTALLLTLNIFLLLMAYYLIKPVREALILEIGDDGAEYKSYVNGAIAGGLLFAVPAYSALASRVKRNRLVISVTLFFASHLALFYAASFLAAGTMAMGFGFYFWVGIFNMMVIAQAWAFTADIYTDEQGKRLFPLVGVGASVGAAVGSLGASQLADTLGTFQMLLLAGGFLVVSAGLTQAIHVRESRAEAPDDADAVDAKQPEKKEKKKQSGAFALVLKNPYLRLLAAFSLLFTLVNTNGEYMVSELVGQFAREVEAAGELGEGVALRDFIAAWYGEFYLYVNLAGVVIQTFVVSRLIKYLGITPTFLILPVVALIDGGLIAAFPMLAILKWGKVTENSIDYSVNNTIRNMLWLPTTREMKYKAKQAVDTFFVRLGDMASAGVVFLLAGTLGLGVRWFGGLNVVLCVVWIGLALRIMAERKGMLRAQGIEEEVPGT